MPVTLTRQPQVDPRLTTPLVLALGLIALFLFAHPYSGIAGDAEIYALQALRRLYPQALGGDVFFRYGSQDSFTIFSPGYAWLIEHFGLDPSAWALTRAFQLALMVAALLLAQQCMERSSVWLALALFMVIPGSYGPHNIFAYGENVLTPRILAEALSLLAIGFALRDRWRATLTALLAALLLHPIMAMPAIICAAVLRSRGRALRLIGGGGVLGLLAAAAIATWSPVGPLRMMDAEWRSTLELLTPFLVAQQWWLADWQRAAVPLAALIIAVFALEPGRARTLAGSALALGGAGLVLLLIATYVAPVVLLMQGQAWRWTWLSRAVAVLLMVPIARALWQRGSNGRAILALIAVAWYGSEDALGLEAALCAVAATVFEYGSARRWRWLWVAVAALALLFAGGIVHLIGLTARLGVAAGAIAIWWAALRSRGAWPRATAALVAAWLCAMQLVATMHGYRGPEYDAVARSLAPWQARIRPDQTVLYLGEGGWPWVALHRRSYFGNVGVLFSRPLAMEMRARNTELQRRLGKDIEWFAPGTHPLRPPPGLTALRRMCDAPGLDFIVAPVSYPVPHLRSTAPAPFHTLALYDCQELRLALDHA